MEQQEKNPIVVAAEHLVGNLWFGLDAVPVIAAKLDPKTMSDVVGGPAAQAYSEMCRLLRSPTEQLDIGSLEAALQNLNWPFKWLGQVQAHIDMEPVETLERYASMIDNAGELRRITIACGKAATEAQDTLADAAQISGELMATLAEREQTTGTLEHISVTVSRLRERLGEIRQGRGLWGAPLGFTDIDRSVRLVDGDLIVVGGRPSQGKSSFARQVLINRAKQIAYGGEEGQVVYFTSDDTADKAMMSMACIEAQVNSRDIRSNKASAEDWAKVEEAMERLEALPMYIESIGRPTVEQLYYRTAMLNSRCPVRLVVHDYLGLIRHPDNRVSDFGTTMTYAADGVKNIATTLNVPWMQLSQLNKSVDNRPDKWPTASDLQYSGEAQADIVMLFMRPEHYISRGEKVEGVSEADEHNVALVNIAKNKLDAVGMVKLFFRKEHSRFDDLDFRHEDLNGF